MIVDTALGRCRLSWSAAGITAVTLLAPANGEGRSDADEINEAPPPFVWRAADLLVRHIAGVPQDFTDIPLDTAGLPPFHCAVYKAARRIGPAQTVTYGELAALAGSPGASRAVGQALARNPFLVVVPCHRVLAAGGRMGGFSAPGGRSTKERLLAIEGWSPPAPDRPPGRLPG